MAGREELVLFLVSLSLGFAVVCGESDVTVIQQKQQYCSFFNNRAPKPQPTLKNCTWYKENSCCLQREIQATFGKVKPLQGASQACFTFINYLTCYICAPNQNLFYRKERLYVCENFCNALYEACNSAILKGSVIRDLYANGMEFCASRSGFIVINSTADDNCFNFNPKVLTSTSHVSSPNCIFIILSFLFCIMWSHVYKPDVNIDYEEINNIKPKKITKKKINVLTNCIRQRQDRTNAFSMCQLTLNYLFISFTVFISTLPRVGTVLVDSPTLVKQWSDSISTELVMLAEAGLHADKIQQFYDEAAYEVDSIDGREKIMAIKQQLGSFFSQKAELARELANAVSALYDEWKANSTTHVPETLLDLGMEYYKDADLPHTLPKEMFNWSWDFKANVMLNHSIVKVPDTVPRDSANVIETVMWTAALDQIFVRNRIKDPQIRWQYFGSSTGVDRSFPGKASKPNFIGFPTDYDPRVRPWYISATSGPKDVVLILDISTSMKQNEGLSRMKNAAKTILSTLTRQDYVGVVISKSTYYTKGGKKRIHKAKVLGCYDKELVPASTSQRKELTAQIDGLKADGGSNHSGAFDLAFNLLKGSSKTGCQSIIIFITDGKEKDYNQRCKAGYFRYDSNNQRSFVPGEMCNYDYDLQRKRVALLQKEMPEKVRIFSVVTHDGDADYPNKLACESGGSLMRVTDTYNAHHQMTPYYTYLEASSSSHSLVWTAPYLDNDGLGLMVTVAVPVYDKSGKSLGVVGIDATMESIESLLLNENWGSAYAFMIDREANAVIHPYSKPSAQLVDDPIYIKIWELETVQGEPRSFSQVVEEMIHNKTGDIKLTKNVQRASFLHDELVWRKTEYTHYFYTNVEDSGYFVALNLAKTDVSFVHALRPDEFNPSYLMPAGDYNVTVAGEDDVVIVDGKLPDHSIVGLAARSFCDPTQYLLQDLPSDQAIQEHINNGNESPLSDCSHEGSIYKDGVRPDVQLTSKIDPFWKARFQSDIEHQGKKLLKKVFIGTSSGVTRIYPYSTRIERSFDPTRRPWYNRAVVSRPKLAVSSVYADAGSLGKVVTISKAITQGKPKNPVGCGSHPYGDGCPCVAHNNCQSQYCYKSSCASDVITAVVGMDLVYSDFQELIINVTKQSAEDSYCGKKYSCNGGKICETRCYIVDDRAELVFDTAIVNTTLNDYNQGTELSLAKKHGKLFQDLLAQGVYKRNTRTDYQAVCLISPNIPPPKILTPEETINSGPIKPFQNQYGCIKRVVYYSSDMNSLPISGVATGNLTKEDPCASGQYYITNIKETNLYLVVLQDYIDTQQTIDWNCHLMNSVFIPNSYEINDDICEAIQYQTSWNYTVAHATCPLVRNVLVPCESSGNKVAPNLLLLLCITFIFYHK